MTSTPPETAEAVLSFWFGPPDPDGRADDVHRRRWFVKDDAFDALLRERFLADHEAVVARRCEDWLATPRGRLAYVIILDQLSRNMFRGTAGMFAHDAQARTAAALGIDRGEDARLHADQRPFLYMPSMHSEDLADQDRCVALFTALRDGADPAHRAAAEGGVKFAAMHRDIIARFGRFPHRNALLGRASTPSEEAFLKEPGSSF
jgi:uncharacterized protein (DUF924 family)